MILLGHVPRCASTLEELQASAWLRAKSFYRYQEERKFAGIVRIGLSIHSLFVVIMQLELNPIPALTRTTNILEYLHVAASSNLESRGGIPVAQASA